VRLFTFRRAVLAAFLCVASLSAQVYTVATPLRAIADPNIALLLVVLGALGIYAEFCLPGLVAPGAIGAILLFLGVTSLSRLPISRASAALMILGVALCVFEARWPARGILTAGGAFGLAFGAVRLIDAADPGVRVRWSTALALFIPFALVTSFLVTVAIRARRNKSICV
jgi:membrane-bound serine protease (ClpP class)